MKRLLLMRHAKTENWYQGTDDEGRALVARGWTDAKRMGETLKARNLQPDLVLVSTARRTRETWKALSEYFDDVEHRVLEELYLCATDTLSDISFAALEGVETLLVIGHNPAMHDLSTQLAEANTQSDYDAQRTLEVKMPTCAIAAFEQDEGSGPLGSALYLVDFLTAKSLRNT